MVLEDQPAWAPHMRSRTPLRSAAKRHFVDPSLATAALSVNPEALIADSVQWGAFEVKLGAGHTDQGAASLTKFASLVDTDRVGPPTVLAVITGDGYGYRRHDGGSVIPIGALGP